MFLISEGIFIAPGQVVFTILAVGALSQVVFTILAVGTLSQAQLWKEKIVILKVTHQIINM